MKFFSLLLLIILVSSCSTGFSESSGWQLYRAGHYNEALEDWEKAAEAGDGGAAFRLGSAYLDGVVVKRSPAEGIKWIKLGVKLGDARAEQELGSIYDCTVHKCSEMGLKRSLPLAAKYYLLAARKGHEVAQYNIATMYEEGIGVDKDYIESYKFYTLAIMNDFATFASAARDKLAYKMSRAEIELAKIRIASFNSGGSLGLGGI